MEFEPSGYSLTAEASAKTLGSLHGYDVPQYSQYLDMIAVHGWLDQKTSDGKLTTGHHTPLYSTPNSNEDMRLNVV